MSTTEKKVTLRFEVADGGAAQQLGKLADNASKAAAASKDLRSSINQPSGSWGGYSPLSGNPMGFPSMAGGYHGPNTGAGFNFASLASAAYRDPTAAFASMRSSGGASAGPSGWDPRALAQAGFTPSSSGWNPAALAASARTQIDPHTGMKIDSYRVDSLRHARYSGTSDEMLQTMNQHRTDPGMLAALGAGAYRLGAAGLKYGVPAIAAVKTASAVASAVHDSDLAAHQGATGGEQMRALANGTWLSRQVLGISDDFRGRSQGMARVQYDQSLERVAREGTEQQRQTRDDIRLQRMQLDARRDVLNADGRMARIGATDRTTVQGELEYGRSLQTMGARQSVFDTERNLKTAEDVKSRQEAMRDDLDRRRSRLEIESGQLAERAKGAGGIERAALLGQRSMKLDEIEKAEQQLDRLNKDIEKSRGDIVQLRGEAGQAKIGAMRANLSILEQREARAVAQGAKFGAMTDLEFDIGASVTAQAKQSGLRSLTPDQLVIAQRFDQGTFDKLAEQEYTRSGRFERLKELGIAEDRIPDARKAVDAERNKVIDAVRDAERNVANEAANQQLGKEFVRELEASISRLVNSKIQAMKVEIQQGLNKN